MLYIALLYSCEYKPWTYTSNIQNLYKVFLDNESFNDNFVIIRDL